MKKSKVAVSLSVAALIGSLMAPTLSFAQSKFQDMTVSAQVNANCNFTTGNSMTFTGYDPAGANALPANPLGGTVVLGVRCTRGATVTIGIDTGAHAGLVGGSTRAMQNGAFNLGYDFYQDAAYSTLWTTVVGAGLYTHIPITNAPTDITIHGRVPGGQDVPAGPYTDTVRVTVNY
jgi:spore coat protein U-like protein